MEQKKINIAELLKDCPSGMELDCTLFEGLEFDSIADNKFLPIRCRVKNPNGGGYNGYNFTKYGCWLDATFAKCVIFPKGKTTWEGFQRPFKDGDVLSYQYKGFKNRTIYIYMQHSRMNTTYYVALSGNSESEFMVNDKEGHALNSYNDSVRFATEEEKAKLFQAIKDNGYKWNDETKTLEKLVEPRFKVGNTIQDENGYKVKITEVNIEDECYGYESIIAKGIGGIAFSEQDNWELVPNKFDITTLKPFDKVLVRCSTLDNWRIQLFEKYHRTCQYPFICLGYTKYKQCIPHEGNEHLLDTKDDCDDFYKTWE